MTRPDGARRLAECFDEVETVELDAGHVMMIEDPGGTNAALGRFLSTQ